MGFWVYLAIAVVTLGFVSSEFDSYDTYFDGTSTVAGVAFFEESREAVNSSDASFHDIGRELQKVMDGFLEGANEENSTEFHGVDAAGCDRGLKRQLEEKCDLQYDKVNEDAQEIEDDDEKTETLCCALEDYEKCCLRAYDKAHCVADKTAIRENLKAARLFLSVVSNVSCSKFRGQCAYYSAAVPAQTIGNAVFIVSTLVSVVLALIV